MTAWLLLCWFLAPIATAQQDHQPSLDELLNLQPPAAADSSPATPGEASTAPIDEQVEQHLSGEQMADLFKQAISEMDQVARRLDMDKNAGVPTQRMQEQILAKLAQVIAAAKQQQQGGGGSGGGQPQQARPQDAGAERMAQQQQGAQAGQGAPPGQGENRSDAFSPGSVTALDNQDQSLHEQRAEWGNLPPRLRDELQQGIGERYSPIYRDLTEAYYKRLAEEGK